MNLVWTDLERRVIHLERTKNKRRRAVPLVGIALDTIRAMSEGKSSAAYVFPAVNRHYTFNSYRKAWKYAVRNAGLTETFRFHDIRHAVASALVYLEINLYIVGTILGHTNPGTMTARYAHLATENLREALETMTNHLFPGRV
jgi:integrase